jgi:hypothetical protein
VQNSLGTELNQQNKMEKKSSKSTLMTVNSKGSSIKIKGGSGTKRNPRLKNRIGTDRNIAVLK